MPKKTTIDTTSGIPRLVIAALSAVTAALAMAITLTHCTDGARAQTTGGVTQSEPQRIVAVGGVVTEILYALGQETQIGRASCRERVLMPV